MISKNMNWKGRFSREIHCPEFARNTLKNPVTGRTIKNDGPVQTWLKKACQAERSSNLSEFVRSQGRIGFGALIDKIVEFQRGMFVPDLKLAFLKGYRGAVRYEMQDTIVDLGSRKFRISTTGPISVRLKNLASPETREGAPEEPPSRDFCKTKNVRVLPQRRSFEPQPHQISAAKFMTKRNARLLLIHGLGSGKTCTSAMIIDDYLRSNPKNLVYFFSPGNLRANFIAEYCSFCPIDRRTGYPDTNNKNFRFFSLDDSSLKKKLPGEFRNCLVVVDEAQSLIDSVKDSSREEEEGDKNLRVLYDRLVVDSGVNTKLLLMSGTPMPDTLQQHYNCLSLLKPRIMSSIPYADFVNMFELQNEGYVPITDRVRTLYSGCMSFYKSRQTDIASVSTTYPEVRLNEQDPLTEVLANAVERENVNRKIPYEILVNRYAKHMTRRQASKKAVLTKVRAAKRSRSCALSNMVYPDDFIGNEETDVMELETADLLERYRTNMDLLFERHCPKIGLLVRNMENGNVCPGKQAVYCPFKTLYGVNLISKILDMRGITNVVYSGDVSQGVRQKILREFNDVSNDRGEVTKVFLFTDAAAEGISLMSIRGIHLVNEDIFASHMSQVTGRAIRYLSHARLPPADRNVRVFRYRVYANDFSSDQDNEMAGMARERSLQYIGRMIEDSWKI